MNRTPLTLVVGFALLLGCLAVRPAYPQLPPDEGGKQTEPRPEDPAKEKQPEPVDPGKDPPPSGLPPGGDEKPKERPPASLPDTVPPTLLAPPDLTVELTAQGGVAVALGECTVSDERDPAPTVTNDAPALFGLGTTPVTWTATDASGNRATAVQLVTLVDTTPPELTVPPDLTVEITSPLGMPVSCGVATAVDAADPWPVVTSDAPALFALGTTVVTWTATDWQGNSSTAAQLVTVVDTTPPVLTLATLLTSLSPANRFVLDVGLTLAATDLGDAAPRLALVVTQNEPPARSEPDGQVLRNPAGVPVGLLLCADRLGRGDGRIYLLLATATDASGNVATRAWAVTVPRSPSARDQLLAALLAARAVSAGVPLAYETAR